MIGLLPSEIRRQVGRKGSFWGAMAWVGVFGIGLLVWSILSNSATGKDALETGVGLMAFAVVLAAIVVGALAGAYDVDQSIMRYLVMTGRPRWQLVFVRVPGLMATVVLFTLPAIVLVALGTLIAGAGTTTGEQWFELFYVTWMTGFCYGILSLAIGMLMKSNGVAIAVAVLLNFAGALIAGAIMEYVSETLGNAFFPIVASVVIFRDAGEGTEAALPIQTSVLLLLVWLGALLGAAYARVHRSEY